MADMLARGDDASMKIVDMLIDTNDGVVDERVAYLVRKVLEKRKRGIDIANTGEAAAAPAEAAPAAAPSAPATAPAAAAQPTAGSIITRLVLGRVQSGDLITAGFMNDIVEALLALDNRLAALEGIAITAAPAVAPTTPTVPSEPRVPRPIINSAEAMTIQGRGVVVMVEGRGLAEGLLNTVLLGRERIPLEGKKFKYTETGFTFMITQKELIDLGPELTVITEGGRDTAEINKVKRPIA